MNGPFAQRVAVLVTRLALVLYLLLQVQGGLLVLLSLSKSLARQLLALSIVLFLLGVHGMLAPRLVARGPSCVVALLMLPPLLEG